MLTDADAPFNHLMATSNAKKLCRASILALFAKALHLLKLFLLILKDSRNVDQAFLLRRIKFHFLSTIILTTIESLPTSQAQRTLFADSRIELWDIGVVLGLPFPIEVVGFARIPFKWGCLEFS